MEITARGVMRALVALAVLGLDPSTVALTAEQVRFGELFVFALVEFLHNPP